MSKKDFHLMMVVISSFALGAVTVLLVFQTIAVFGGAE